MSSNIIEAENKTLFEKNLLDKLKGSKEFASTRVIQSPRAVGDIVEGIVRDVAPVCFSKGLITNYKSSFQRRAMEDIAFNDIDGNYFAVDIKTHNKSTKFNMPNITSVNRLAKFYEDDKNYFVILFVEYDIIDEELVFTNVSFNLIEHFCWDCLTVGALGWGQIQVANASYISIKPSSHKEWMIKLCDALDAFYPKFKKVRDFWKQK